MQEQYGEVEREELAAQEVKVAVAGRMMLKRVMGKASFATIQDASGPKADGRIQLYITNELAGEAAHDAFKHYDLGDILGAEGTLFKTKTGELSIKVTNLRLLTKSLRPLPDKFHGLSDQETKYRQRYVDLIINEETRRTFKARTAAMSSIRHFMEKNDFMEVETPMLHAIPGGAAAKPFITHHNALDMEMFLRIAPELYLKRLVVGGFERVFEVNRNFRNEGVSPRHNPEFTMMEFYAAYVDYKWLMDFTEAVIRQAAIDAHGTATLTYQGRELDLSQALPPPDHRRRHQQVRAALHPRAVARRRLPEAGTEEVRRHAAHHFRPRRAATGAVRGNRRSAVVGADLHHRLPGRSVAAGARLRHACPASPSASSCSSPAAKSPTASRN